METDPKDGPVIDDVHEASPEIDPYDMRIFALSAGLGRVGRLEAPRASGDASSRPCGSHVHVEMSLDAAGRVVGAFAHLVEACVLGRAAAAVMAANVVGSSPRELRALADEMRAMLRSGGPPPTGRWSDLEVLSGVHRHPMRRASVLLPFEAVEVCLDQLERGGACRR